MQLFESVVPKRKKETLDLEYSETILKEIRDREAAKQSIEEAKTSDEPLAIEGSENKEVEDGKKVDVNPIENGVNEQPPA